MDEKKILSLKAQLVQLGFEPSVETMLRCNICFMLPQFDLQMIKKVGKDCFHFLVHVEKADAELYALKYYTATLRKMVMVPEEMEKLDRVMGSIDWKELVVGKDVVVALDTVT